MNSRRLLRLGLLSGAIAAALAYGFWPQAAPVDLGTVVRGPLQVSFEEEGKTRVIDRYTVSAPVDGVACRIDLKVGDPVKRQQTLLKLEPLPSAVLDPRSAAEARARVAAAASAVKAAEEQARAADAEARQARSELDRLEPLVEPGHVSREALDRAATTVRSREASLQSAQFAVEVARHELEAAQTALQYSAARTTSEPVEAVDIRAPVDGRILSVAHPCRGVVRAGQPLLEIGDTRKLEVVVPVLSRDAVRLPDDARVELERWGEDLTLPARIRRIEPVAHTRVSALGVEEQRVDVILDLTAPREAWQKLGDGYRVQARFVVWESQDVLKAPSAALFRADDGWATLTVKDGRAHQRVIRPGRDNGLETEIQEGLAESDLVIVHPDGTVGDGDRVRPR